ncbi:MAG TPA: histidine phosphatase family protein [Kineosporiaceae bacterium]
MRLRPGPATLWFVRHGESEGNVARDAAQARGLHEVVLPVRDSDVPLSALGRRQAEAFGRWLAGLPPQQRPTSVVVSPYERARRTAALLQDAAGRALPVRRREVDERLRDREIGIWDGLTWAGIRARFPHEAERALRVGRYYHRPPGGESWADVMLRLRSLFADLADDGWAAERALLVSHDLTIQLARAVIEGVHEPEVVRLVSATRYANCALSAFEADGARYRRTAYNLVVPGAPATNEPVAEPATAGPPVGREPPVGRA